MNLEEFSKNRINKSNIFKNIIAATSFWLDHPIAKDHKNYINSRFSGNIQKEFKIGFFPPDEYLPDFYNYVDESSLIDSGIVYDSFASNGIDVIPTKKSIFHNHNLIFPYENLYGDIICLVGRTVLSSEEMKAKNISKYKNSQCSKILNLYGLNRAKEAILIEDCVIVVEGQFDMMMCYDVGIRNIVALGGLGFSKYHLYLLKRYTNNIKLLLDNDDKGKEATNEIIKKYGTNANISKISINSNHKDIYEYIKEGNSLSIFR